AAVRAGRRAQLAPTGEDVLDDAPHERQRAIGLHGSEQPAHHASDTVRPPTRCHVPRAEPCPWAASRTDRSAALANSSGGVTRRYRGGGGGARSRIVATSASSVPPARSPSTCVSPAAANSQIRWSRVPPMCVEPGPGSR